MKIQYVNMFLLALLAGCGGGSKESTDSVIQTHALATASVVLKSSESTLQWNLPTAMTVTLRDSSGAVVPSSSLTCTAVDKVALTTAADCSSVKAQRLGTQQIQVAGNGSSATLSLKVIPQRQPIAIHGIASSYGSGDYNLLVNQAGNVLAWGANPSGVLGQGVGLSEPKLASLPIMVKNADGTGNLTGIVSASAGDIEALALTEDGEVLVWGSDQVGVAGGSHLPVKVRNPVNSGNLQHIVQVAMGKDNVAALADDGTVYTWGFFTGQGTTSSIKFPNQVKDSSGAGVLSNIVAISAGSDFTLALSADGKVFAWGWDDNGQTGRGTNVTQEPLPAPVKLASDNADLSDIVAISAGYNFSLALTADGKVYAWGNNRFGQLGQGLTSDNYPRAVPVKNSTGTGILSDIRMVSAGGWFGMALDMSGHVLSWGFSADGALGDGSNGRRDGDYLKPLPVVGLASTGQLADIAAIGAGYEHGFAISTDGSVLIWGSGFGGNLGQGGTNTSKSAVPLKVKDPTGSGTLSLAPLAGYQNLLGRGR